MSEGAPLSTACAGPPCLKFTSHKWNEFEVKKCIICQQPDSDRRLSSTATGRETIKRAALIRRCYKTR